MDGCSEWSDDDEWAKLCWDRVLEARILRVKGVLNS